MLPRTLLHQWTSNLQIVRHFSASSAVDKTGLIKQLRERSGLGITDVKKSLEAHNWDLEAAYETLRKKGLAAAAKKANRHAAEGLIGCVSSQDKKTAVIVEINSETDFVARNDLFQQLVGQVAAAALASQGTATAAAQSRCEELPIDQVLQAKTDKGTSVSDAVTEVAAQMRENVRLRRAFVCSSATGCVSTYVHQSPAPGLGRIAAVLSIEPRESTSGSLTEAQVSQISEVGHNLAVHAAGMKPQYLTRADIPAAVLDKEREILRAHPSTAGKPAAVVAKIVEGRLSKFYEETVLEDQPYLIDDTVKVAKVLQRLSKDVGTPLRVASLLRVQCGEGLETQQGAKDFAAEVRELAGQSTTK